MATKPRWPMPTRVEEVRWVDHNGGMGWAKTESYAKDRPTVCRSVGYLLREDRHSLTLIQSQDSSNDNLNGSIIIAKRLLLSRRTLRKR